MKRGVPRADPKRPPDQAIDHPATGDLMPWRMVHSIKYRGGCELLYVHEATGAQLLVEMTRRGMWKTYADPKTGATFDNEEALIDFISPKADNSAIRVIHRLRRKLVAHGIDPDEPDLKDRNEPQDTPR